MVVIGAGHVCRDDTRPLVGDQRVLLLEAAELAPPYGYIDGRLGGGRHQPRAHLKRIGLGQAQVCIDRRCTRNRSQIVDAADREAALHLAER